MLLKSSLSTVQTSSAAPSSLSTCMIISLITTPSLVYPRFFGYRVSSFHLPVVCLGLLITAEWAVNDAFVVTLSAGWALFDLSVSDLQSVCSLTFFFFSPTGGSDCRVNLYFDRISVRPSITRWAAIQAAEEVEGHNTNFSSQPGRPPWRTGANERRAQRQEDFVNTSK